MAISLYPAPKVQYFDDDGSPLNGGKVYFYTPGTANLKDTYTDQGGGTANPNPVILDAFGRAEIWLNGSYDVTLDRSDDTNVWTVEDVSSAGATTTTISEWISPGDTPTFIDTTNFSVAGDQTATYQVGRRVRIAETAGTVYGRVSNSAYTTLTTVTVVLDSGTVDSGISVVDVGILTVTNQSIPYTNIIKPDATALTHAPTTEQIVSGGLNYIADTGAADVYVATLPIALAAYVAGMPICVKIINANTITTPTLNVNALGADTIKRENGAALLVGDLPAGYMAVFRHDGTDAILINPALVVNHDHSGITEGGTSVNLSEDYVLVRDEKATNTAGGTFTAGAWQIRTLNTEVEDTGSNASLATNQVTLQAGTYRFKAMAQARLVNGHKLRLWNDSDSSTVIIGMSHFADGAVSETDIAHISGRFTIASAKAFELQHFCATTAATSGFGIASNLDSSIEVYAQIEFWKETS